MSSFVLIHAAIYFAWYHFAEDALCFLVCMFAFFKKSGSSDFVDFYLSPHFCFIN